LSIWFFKNIIADRERKIMHDLAYMWILKKLNKLERENRTVTTRDGEVEQLRDAEPSVKTAIM
jgi:hypothetical protein